MHSNRPLTLIEGEIIHDREKAWCYRLPDGRDIWIAKSTAHQAKDGRLMVRTWLVEKEGLEEWVR